MRIDAVLQMRALASLAASQFDLLRSIEILKYTLPFLGLDLGQVAGIVGLEMAILAEIQLVRVAGMA